MMRRLTETYRIIPPRQGLVIVLILSVSGLAFIAWSTVLQDVAIPLPLLFVIVCLLLLVAQSISQLLPGSPGDFLEVGPEGLTVGGPFGRRYRRWEDIESFSTFLFPTRAVPIAQVRAISRHRGVRNMGFSMGGYVKLGWFDEIQERQRDLSDWFENVKAAYTGGNHSGSLPEVPGWFVGCLIAPPLSRPRIPA